MGDAAITPFTLRQAQGERGFYGVNGGFQVDEFLLLPALDRVFQGDLMVLIVPWLILPARLLTRGSLVD
jgi:hypothetical protein